LKKKQKKQKGLGQDFAKDTELPKLKVSKLEHNGWVYVLYA
jgi:hypothetical protein